MDNWITLSTLSGDSGTTIVTITAATQQELVERTTSFTVKTNYTNLQQVVEVEQLVYSGLRFNITNGGNIYWIGSSSKTIQYRKNGGEWISITSTTGSGVDIPVQSGDILFFKGDNDEYRYSSFSASTGTNFKVSGNIMSLIDSTNYENLTTLSSAYTFNGLFQNCSGLTDASELLLPATTLAERCYQGMFKGCTSLTTAPALPATTLSDFCYVTMFSGCTSLTTAPALPATTLTTGCYGSIFRNCTNLTGTPELPATTLANSCYGSMFYGCSGLTQASALPATTLKQGCYNNMFNGCSNLTTAPALPATRLAPVCYINMFSGCTSLTQAPTLPATTLADNCYQGMFANCTSLTQAPVLPATTLVSNCYNQMFYGCGSLNYIKCLATDISAYDCTLNWVSGVAATGTFYKPEEMEDWVIDSVNGIPIGWTIDTTRPYLTFIISQDGYINYKILHHYYDVSNPIEYKINDGNWVTISAATYDGVHINVVAGDNVYVRGNNKQYASYNDSWGFDSSTAGFSLSGNIMSLINATDFGDLTTLESAYTFCNLFTNCTGLTDASELLLPATTLTERCYESMFYGCSNLTTAPELPATTLAEKCYLGMFRGCTSLVNVPSSIGTSATTMAASACTDMFYGCSGLTDASNLELPATTLARHCYSYMFGTCTSLVNVPALPATTLATNCYGDMFWGCTSLTGVSITLLPATTLVEWCYSGMFAHCTSLVNAPALPATRLAPVCYQGMFWGCTSLTKAPVLPATNPDNECYEDMFYNCSNLNEIKCYLILNETTNPSTNWVYGVQTNSGTFKCLPQSNWTISHNFSGIPDGWTVEYIY